MGLFAGLAGGTIQSSNQITSVGGMVAFITFTIGMMYYAPREEKIFSTIVIVGVLALAWNVNIVVFVVLVNVECAMQLYYYGQGTWDRMRQWTRERLLAPV